MYQPEEQRCDRDQCRENEVVIAQVADPGHQIDQPGGMIFLKFACDGGIHPIYGMEMDKNGQRGEEYKLNQVECDEKQGAA